MKEKMLKIKDKLAGLVSGLAGVFRDFPFTMASILVAALFASIVLHLDHDDKGREICERIMVFAFWMALQSFVIEEILRKKLAAKMQKRPSAPPPTTARKTRNGAF